MKIVRQYARSLYGIESRITGDPEQQIGEVWQRFLAENLAEEIPSRLTDQIVAMYCEYEGDHTKPYTFFLGCEVIDVCSVEDGFALRTTPAGNYAEFHARGAMPLAIIDAWKKISAANLQRNFVADYEIYDPEMPEYVAIFVGFS